MAGAIPVYLFIGPEFGERNEAVDKVKSDLKKKFGDSEEHLRYCGETRVADVVAELSSESLFCPATLVVLKGAEQIKLKDDIEILKTWIEGVGKSGRDSSVLILVSDETSVDSKLDKLIPKENKKIFWEMFEDRKESWLRNFFQKNGFSATQDAIEEILEMVENNTEALKGECSIFFSCFPQGYQITADDVEKILSHNREESAFTLFDAMADSSETTEKRLEKSLSILQKLCLSKNSGVGVSLISGLLYCFRRLVIWHTINSTASGAPSSASEIELRQNGFTSKKAQGQYRKAARIWNKAQAQAIVSLLGKKDIEIRSSGTALEQNLLSLMIYEIVAKNGIYCSSYDAN